MYCKNCNNQLNDNPRFCPFCGQEQEAPASEGAPVAPEQTDLYGSSYEQATEEKKDELAGATLKWGILSLAFSTTFFLSLLGFIFSFVAKAKAREYVRLFGEVEGRSRVGRDLGTAGFIVGLILTILSALYWLLIFIVVLAAMLGGLGY